MTARLIAGGLSLLVAAALIVWALLDASYMGRFHDNRCQRTLGGVAANVDRIISDHPMCGVRQAGEIEGQAFRYLECGNDQRLRDAVVLTRGRELCERLVNLPSAETARFVSTGALPQAVSTTGD